MIEEFSPEVREKLGYYVYRLIDPRSNKTFYVGKGQGNRVFQHVKYATDKIQKLAAEADDDAPDCDNQVSLKTQMISEIIAAGLDVGIVIHRHGIRDEATALAIEAALIDAYDDLINLQSGHNSNDFGVIEVDDLERKYNMAEIEKFADNCLIIKIRKSFIEKNGGSIYETVRSSWKLGPKRERAKYVLAVVNGIVREIYENMQWQQNDKHTRWLFTANEVKDKAVRAKYWHKRLPSEYQKVGQANPCLYTY